MTFKVTKERYDALMDVVMNRMTVRAFDQDYEVPKSHYELILEAARHGPSGANTQPWHYIVITEPQIKQSLAEYFVKEQRQRAKLKMKFPTPDYRGLGAAPGVIVVVSDFRWTKAFPNLREEDSKLNAMYKENAERILLQSVAASTMSAHLAASALGYSVWWITAIGQQEAQDAIKPLLGIPEELSVLDVMCFGPSKKEPYKRWKKSLNEIFSWNTFDQAHFLTEKEIDTWIQTQRSKVMYRDEAKID
ncbi:MAG: hypothetical protein CMM56_06620 [Rhodospirillaceae bacterium]|nr:hypothetical protein [Rhodospirillaceae bacterium]